MPSDIVGGEFRIWDPAVHNSSIFHESVVPEPTQRLQIQVSEPTFGALSLSFSARAGSDHHICNNNCQGGRTTIYAAQSQ